MKFEYNLHLHLALFIEYLLENPFELFRFCTQHLFLNGILLYVKQIEYTFENILVPAVCAIMEHLKIITKIILVKIEIFARV